MDITVEFLGPARELAATKSCAMRLDDGATFHDLLSSLVSRFPSLAGHIIDPDARTLTPAYMLNVGGRRVVNDLDEAIKDGHRVLLMFAEAGG